MLCSAELQIKNRNGSQFWRSLLDLRPWYQKGRIMEIISGNQTRFWKDCWLGDCPLEISFHKLYLIASQPDIEASKAFVDGQWCITFRRQLNENLQQDLNDLLALLREVSLTE